jgi:hypothetical protein
MWRMGLIVGLVLAATVAFADVYKCPDGKGGTVYQGVPCVAGEDPIIKGENKQQARQQEITEAVTRIGQRPLPSDYRDKIDRAFVRMLKDPDSRKIEYVGQAYGSAVCGMVNARNALGGYTGRQVFLAYFDGTGSLEHLKVYNDEDFSVLRYHADVDVEPHLLRRCGLALE